MKELYSLTKSVWRWFLYETESIHYGARPQMRAPHRYVHLSAGRPNPQLLAAHEVYVFQLTVPYDMVIDQEY